MPVTSAPYNGTSKRRLPKTHSIPDADPSMLSNMRTNTGRHTKYTTLALNKLSELPSISVLIRLLFLIPYDFHVAAGL